MREGELLDEEVLGVLAKVMKLESAAEAGEEVSSGRCVTLFPSRRQKGGVPILRLRTVAVLDFSTRPSSISANPVSLLPSATTSPSTSKTTSPSTRQSSRP